VPVVEELHGVSVADPYRRLERYEPDTNAWIAEQARFARRYLDSIPERRAVERRVERLWTFERYGIPVVEGGRRFYTYADGVRNQPVLMVEEADGRARVLLDPNTMRRDGTAALAGFWPDRSGRLLAYAMAEAGSDWNVIRVRDVATGRDLPDRIEWTKFSGAA
jgi:prolyl oligopeptidase